MMPRWFLDPDEERFVGHTNDRVLAIVHRRGAIDAFDYKDERTERGHSHSCEYLLARETGQTWNTPNNIATPGYVDVGTLDESRWRAFPRGALILYPGDSPAYRYSLQGGDNISGYVFRGWILGADGMVDRYWVEKGDVLPGTDHRCKRGGWFVPQSALHSFEELLAVIHPQPVRPGPEEPVQLTVGDAFG